ncbi:MAG TPA: HEPN domain-containing protein [Nitrospiraceae bacterium]|nr:HEPN domain-containing protein [Nitrospiraceae bacterium]
MKTQAVREKQQRLDNIFSQVSSFSGDAELQSHWARYLCILVSGFLETSVQHIYIEYSKKRSASDVAGYVERRLKQFQNPQMKKILDLTGSFNPAWREALKVATEGQTKDAVDSIVANRNTIAHGESVGITYSRIKEYYQNALKVIELIDRQCNP